MENRKVPTIKEILSRDPAKLGEEGQLIHKGLELFLDRKIETDTTSKNYHLPSYSSIFGGALPFMRAGAREVKRGEIVFLAELLDQFLHQSSMLRELVLGIESRDNGKYLYSQKVEDEILARLFLKSESLDSFDSIINNCLNLLLEQDVLSAADCETLKKAFQLAEMRLNEVTVQITNVIPAFASKLLRVDGPSEKLEFEKNIHITHNTDKRPLSLEGITSVAKELLREIHENRVARNSISLGVFTAVTKELDDFGFLGLIVEKADSKLRRIKLIPKIRNETNPPQHGPVRAMMALMLDWNGYSISNLQNFNISDKIRNAIENDIEYLVVTHGAVSSPGDPSLVARGAGLLVDPSQSEITSAGELFSFVPGLKEAILLDPVSVTYQNIADEYMHFKATRICFFLHNLLDRNPHYAGKIAIGADLLNYETACLEGSKLASDIISKSFDYISGERGNINFCKSRQNAIDVLTIKYSDSPAIKFTNGTEESVLAAASGLMGRNNGMANEIYSLFFQNDSSSSPLSYLACLEAPRFLCNVRTYPQRFNLFKYFNDA